VKQIAVLFARDDSIYKTLPGCDVWDKVRDAVNFQGPSPVIAHPPCRAWGRLRKLANPEPGEKDLAFFAVDAVRKYGGVLEHPAGSTLWYAAGLPEGGLLDEFGGWTLPISQKWFGHRAEKKTLLYIVGITREELPPIPYTLGEATHVCCASGRRKDGKRLLKGDQGWRPEITKSEREATPAAFAKWLCAIAMRCSH
jgi:hypothetical protein